MKSLRYNNHTTTTDNNSSNNNSSISSVSRSHNNSSTNNDNNITNNINSNITDANNNASEHGGGIHAIGTSVATRNTSLVGSVAGITGGGVSLTGETSSGTFYSTTFFRCSASQYGGAIAASNNVPQLTIQDGVFSQCHVGEQGGAIRFDGKGKVRVENTTYQDCSVGFSAEPICLTLTMFDATGDGWSGAEVFIFNLIYFDFVFMLVLHLPTAHRAFAGARLLCVERLCRHWWGIEIVLREPEQERNPSA